MKFVTLSLVSTSKDSSHHPPTVSTHHWKCLGKQTAGLVGKQMARDNVKHRISQVSITIIVMTWQNG